jgi:hypothetical protein
MVSLPTVLDHFGSAKFNVRQHVCDKTKATFPVEFIGKLRSSSIRSAILSEENEEEDVHNSKVSTSSNN